MAGKRKKTIPPILGILLILLAAGALFFALITVIKPKNHPLSFDIPKLPGKSAETADGSEENGSAAEQTAQVTPTETPTPTPEPTPEPVDPSKIQAGYSAEAPTQYFTDNGYLLFVDSAEGSSELVQSDPTINNSPIRAFDGDVASSWQEGADGFGEGQSITARFNEPVSVACMKLRLGNWKSEEAYQRNGRPQTLQIDLGGQSYTIEFPDEMKEHYVVFSEPMPNVDSVVFTIGQTYNSYFPDCCISEIEFFKGIEE